MNFFKVIVVVASSLLVLKKSEAFSAFEEVGEMASGLSYAHLSIPVDLEHLRGLLTSHRTTASRAMRELTSELQITTTGGQIKAYISNWMGRHDDSYRKLIQRFDAHTALFDEGEAEATRPRRQILGVLGLGVGIYNSYKLAKLSSLVNGNTELVGSLYNATDVKFREVDEKLTFLNKTVDFVVEEFQKASSKMRISALTAELDHHLNEIKDECQGWLTGLSALFRGRLSPDLFDLVKLKRAVKSLQDRAAQDGFQYIHSTIGDVFSMETSHLRHGSMLHIFVHVPVSSGTRMKVYRMIPTPVHLASGLTVMVSPEKDLLVVDQGNTMGAETSSSELQECRRSHNLYFCDNLRVFDRHLEDTCVGSLFVANIEKAKEHCRVEVGLRDREVLTPLNQTAFRLATPKTITLFTTCGVGPTRIEEGETIVDIPGGCAAYTPNKWFLAGTTTEIVPSDISMDMPDKDPKLLFDFEEVTFEEVKEELLSRPKKSGTRSAWAHEVRAQLRDQRRAERSYSLHGVNLVIAGGCSLLVMLLLAWLIYRKIVWGARAGRTTPDRT